MDDTKLARWLFGLFELLHVSELDVLAHLPEAVVFLVDSEPTVQHVLVICESLDCHGHLLRIQACEFAGL